MRRLMLALSITCFIATSAFAHGHHSGAYAGSSSSRSSAHNGFGHHNLASADDRANARNDSQSLAGNDQNQSVAANSNPRKHERVPDEEELQQAEQ